MPVFCILSRQWRQLDAKLDDRSMAAPASDLAVNACTLNTFNINACPEDRRIDVPQLSCDLCRERKVKCDKLDPCTNCTVAGVTCSTIYRRRLTRGRHVSRPAQLSQSQGISKANGRRTRSDAAAHALNKLRSSESVWSASRT